VASCRSPSSSEDRAVRFFDLWEVGLVVVGAEVVAADDDEEETADDNDIICYGTDTVSVGGGWPHGRKRVPITTSFRCSVPERSGTFHVVVF